MRSVLAVGAAMLLVGIAGSAHAQENQQQGGQQQFEADEATFQQWDANGDGKLSREEFTKGARSAGLFNMWDGNGDGRIDQNEYDQIGFEGDFGVWDQNNTGYLDPNEVYSGVFQTNDQNEDGQWTMEEWENFGGGSWFDFDW